MDRLKKMILSKETKVAFISAMIIGFIAHFYILTNDYGCWDDFVSLAGTTDYTFLGRPLTQFFGLFSTPYSLPAVNGTLALLFVSVTVVMIVDLFDIKKIHLT